MHDFRRDGSPVECSMAALVAEIEAPPQSAGYTPGGADNLLSGRRSRKRPGRKVIIVLTENRFNPLVPINTQTTSRLGHPAITRHGISVPNPAAQQCSCWTSVTASPNNRSGVSVVLAAIIRFVRFAIV